MRPALLAVILSAGPVWAEPAIDLRIVFDPGAAQALNERGELVTVSAYFYATPGPEAGLPLDEMDYAYLGREQVTFWAGDRSLRLGTSLVGAPLDRVPELYVNVNVFTDRRTDEYNLIGCDFLDELVATAAAAPRTLTCRLLPPPQ